ncbi:MAG: hypothetical protein ACRD2X_18230 [Vicinamibacteraceae bacterium]
MLALFMRPAAAAAQAEELGRIERMLRLGLDDSSAEHTCGPTSDVAVQRRGGSVWQDGSCELAVILEDRIRVRPRTVVRLKLRSVDGEGDIALSADSLFSEIGGADEAFYTIRETPEQITGWELAVTRGSLALHWVRGQLALFIEGTRAIISGTRVVVSADPDGETSTLHLIEGDVSFPDYPDVTLSPGESARLRPNAAPVVTAAGPALAERFQRTAEWAVDDAWGRPFYTKPWLYAGIAAVAGGVAVWRISSGDDKRYRGTIIIRIPW